MDSSVLKRKNLPNGMDRRPQIPVLIMSRELHLGGTERDAAKIAMHLDRSRFEPHVATFYARGLRYEELCAAKIPILHLPVRSLLSTGALQHAAIMRAYVKKHGIQVVHSYDATGLFAAVAGRLAGVPLIITSQLSYRDILHPRTQPGLPISDRFAHAVLVNCEAIRRYMIQDEGVPAERIELCYNGVDTSQFYVAKEPLPDVLKGSSLVLGTVCVLRPEKGLTVLQEAFARVLPMDPRMKLLIVGSGVCGDDELRRLQENAVRLGIASASVFEPATREVARWMRVIDIYALPSYSEAFSNALLEAMACGCCAVGSRVGGTPELIGENERGRLFEKGNAADMADRLAELIANDSVRRELGARAARFARENLSIEVAAARTGAIYERLLARQKAKSFGVSPATIPPG